MRALLLAAVLVAPASAELPGVYLGAKTVSLRYRPECILEAVARDIADVIGRYRGPEIEAALRGAARAASVPRVRLESATPTNEFVAAVRSQDPTLDHFTNIYAVGVNQIFLIDDAAYYAKFTSGSRRSMDDSLAHEYVHYIQVAYLGYTVANLATDDAETTAIEYQTRFRERYVIGGATPPCP